MHGFGFNQLGTIDAATRTFPVEIKLDNKDMRVRPGMFARVTINFGTERRVVLPDLAVVKQTGSGDRYVYVYEDGKVDFDPAGKRTFPGRTEETGYRAGRADEPSGRSSFRWTETGTDASDGDNEPSKTASSGRAYCST